MKNEINNNDRPRFATRFGVIATTVGSAVGLGNIWRFPYETGANGGGAFLLLYIFFVIVVGIPVISAEFLVGRESRRNILGAYHTLAPSHRRLWAAAGSLGIISSVLILSFYSVVAGWTLEYLTEGVTGRLNDFAHGARHAAFDSFTAGWACVAWTIVVLLINALILLGGVRKGIERVSNSLMPLLFVILLALCINSLLLPGAADGLKFLFAPDFSHVTGRTVLNALGQAFFSLSLGVGTMIIYGSYFSSKTPIVKSATTTAVLDTMVAVMAGVLIFPAVFSFGASPAAGPKLVFEVLPDIFAMMPGGAVWAPAFFLLLALASITSTISMSEICIAFICEQWGVRRRTAIAINTLIAVCLGSLCALSFGPLADFKICGFTVFNLFDFLTSNLLMPLGGMFVAIFTGHVISRSIVDAQLAPAPRHIINAIVFSLRYIAPTAIAIIFVSGLL